MKPCAVIFDRDGTLIEEPADGQVDSLDKVRFMPGVFAALSLLQRHGYGLVIVTNQDGLGTSSYPQASYELVQGFLIDAFGSQGILQHARHKDVNDATGGALISAPGHDIRDQLQSTAR